MTPRYPEVPTLACDATDDVLARIGDKWAMRVLGELAAGGRVRFSDLRRRVGTASRRVSQKVLTATLRGLERDGFLTRTVTPTVPPRVDYELTEMGRGVLVPLGTICRWAADHRGRVAAARAAYDGRPPAEADGRGDVPTG